MWGSVNKRLWKLAKRTAAPAELYQGKQATEFLEEAIRANKREYYLGNDCYITMASACLFC